MAENGRSIWVVGTARDVGRRITASIGSLHRVFSHFGETHFFVVESNSSDNTIQELQFLSETLEDFSFETLGCLSEGFEQRTTRLAECRNRYLDFLCERRLTSNDLVVVADLDGVNDDLTESGVEHSLGIPDWDVVTANQSGRYYDIWALRHPVWCPSDYLDYSNFLVGMGYSHWAAYWRSVRARQIRIGPDQEPIEVDSAFGGLAIYRSWVIGTARYSGTSPEGRVVSEHVPFHHDASRAGARIFINPRMVNTHKTEHTALLRLAGKELVARLRKKR